MGSTEESTCSSAVWSDTTLGVKRHVVKRVAKDEGGFTIDLEVWKGAAPDHVKTLCGRDLLVHGRQALSSKADADWSTVQSRDQAPAGREFQLRPGLAARSFLIRS